MRHKNLLVVVLWRENWFLWRNNNISRQKTVRFPYELAGMQRSGRPNETRRVPRQYTALFRDRFRHRPAKASGFDRILRYPIQI